MEVTDEGGVIVAEVVTKPSWLRQYARSDRLGCPVLATASCSQASGKISRYGLKPDRNTAGISPMRILNLEKGWRTECVNMQFAL